MNNIQQKRKFLQEIYPEMAERTDDASDLAIEIIYSTLNLSKCIQESYTIYLESRLSALK